jgi:hypothetical protein
MLVFIRRRFWLHLTISVGCELHRDDTPLVKSNGRWARRWALIRWCDHDDSPPLIQKIQKSGFREIHGRREPLWMCASAGCLRFGVRRNPPSGSEYQREHHGGQLESDRLHRPGFLVVFQCTDGIRPAIPAVRDRRDDEGNVSPRFGGPHAERHRLSNNEGRTADVLVSHRHRARERTLGLRWHFGWHAARHRLRNHGQYGVVWHRGAGRHAFLPCLRDECCQTGSVAQ